MKKGKKHFNISNARTQHQLKKMMEFDKRGICLFCREHIEKEHREPILRETNNWIITRNDYPYEGTKYHFLLVYKKHVDSIEKISSGGAADFFDNIKWIKKKYKVSGASLLMRFGNNEYTGATITHLHAHVVVGKKKTKKTQPLMSVLGWK